MFSVVSKITQDYFYSDDPVLESLSMRTSRYVQTSNISARVTRNKIGPTFLAYINI